MNTMLWRRRDATREITAWSLENFLQRAFYAVTLVADLKVSPLLLSGSWLSQVHLPPQRAVQPQQMPGQQRAVQKQPQVRLEMAYRPQFAPQVGAYRSFVATAAGRHEHGTLRRCTQGVICVVRSGLSYE